MLEPAPTTKLAPDLARGTLAEIVPATATTPALLVLKVHNSDYLLRLAPGGGVERFQSLVGQKVIGRITARAKRIDVVGAGGRLIDPVQGRPRRVQGSVLSADSTKNTLVVSAGGVAINVTPTDPRQKAAMFQAGQFVSFDVERGAGFTLVE